MSAATNLDKIIQRFGHRPGCRFVSAREIGIAVYVLDLRVVALEPRDIPPIDEFLLRALRLSIERPAELSSFLGLDPRTVHNRLIELRRVELIEVSPTDAGDDVRCRLTLKGTTVTNSLQRSELTEVTIPDVVFHGFLRRPILLDKNELLRPRDLQSGLTAVPPIPSRKPTTEEIKLSELSEVVKRQWIQKRRGKPPELVNVRSILNVRTMYLPAVLLQYELLGRKKQQQVAFVVEGLMQDEYERAFAKCAGPDRIPDLLVSDFKTTAELAADVLPPHLVRELGPLREADELVEQLDQVTAEVERKESVLQAEDRPDTREVLRQELEKEKSLRSQLEQKIANIKVRSLKTYDCSHLLRTTLRDVKNRLVILSGFLSSHVVDRQFMESLEAAVKRQVKVWIGYGPGKQGRHDQERRERSDSMDAERALRQLCKKYPGIVSVKNFDTHEKILLRDNDFVVTGSYNWLSFRPKGRVVRYEDAAQVIVPEFIEEKFQEIVTRFEKLD